MQNLQEQINQARRHPVTMSVVGVDRARVRFAKQGATNVRYGMLPIHV